MTEESIKPVAVGLKTRSLDYRIPRAPRMSVLQSQRLPLSDGFIERSRVQLVCLHSMARQHGRAVSRALMDHYKRSFRTQHTELPSSRHIDPTNSETKIKKECTESDICRVSACMR